MYKVLSVWAYIVVVAAVALAYVLCVYKLNSQSGRSKINVLEAFSQSMHFDWNTRGTVSLSTYYKGKKYFFL